MSNEKVSQMTPLTAAELALDDVLLITDNSQKQSKKIAINDLLVYFEATGTFNAVHANLADSASSVPGSGVSGNVLSASHSNFADTASFALNLAGFVGSLVTGSLVPITSSYSQTASFLLYSSGRNNGTASFAISASSVNFTKSASFLTYTPGLNSGTASFALSASQASTASFAITASSVISASFATNAATASLATTASFVVTNVMPAGTVITFAASTVPAGWLECNGAVVSQSIYPALYASIGLTYGSGNDAGATTFTLPDLRGYFIRGWDHGRGIDTGRNIGTSQLDALKDHTHNLPGFLMIAGSNFSPTGNNDRGGSITGNVTLPNGGFTETRPLNIAMMYLIKT